MPVHEVNEQLGVRLSLEDVETIGGFVFSRPGRVPEVGDEVEAGGYLFRVESVEDSRIERLVIEVGDGVEEDEEAEKGEGE